MASKPQVSISESVKELEQHLLQASTATGKERLQMLY